MKSRGAEALIIGHFGIGSVVLQQGIWQPAIRIPPYIIWHFPESGKRLMLSELNTAIEKAVRIAFFTMESV